MDKASSLKILHWDGGFGQDLTAWTRFLGHPYQRVEEEVTTKTLLEQGDFDVFIYSPQDSNPVCFPFPKQGPCPPLWILNTPSLNEPTWTNWHQIGFDASVDPFMGIDHLDESLRMWRHLLEAQSSPVFFHDEELVDYALLRSRHLLDDELVEQLIAIYHQMLPKHLENLTQSLEEDCQALKEVAHSLKGLAVNVGAKKLPFTPIKSNKKPVIYPKANWKNWLTLLQRLKLKQAGSSLSF